MDTVVECGACGAATKRGKGILGAEMAPLDQRSAKASHSLF